MIICVCNNISDRSPFQDVDYICGKCQQYLNKYENLTILERHDNFSLAIKENTYYVFEGYNEIGKFQCYNEALEFFQQCSINH